MMRLDLSSLTVPKLGLAAFKGRIILRAAFLFLIIATLLLALILLKEEKRRSHQSYAQGLQKTHAEILARLRHPTGQLALLNPARKNSQPIPLRPLLLPYAALDFDDQNKAQQAVEMAGCLIHYPEQGDVCVAIGNNPYAGGFIYIVGNFLSTDLIGRERGELNLTKVFRARISLDIRGKTFQWIAPYEAISELGTNRTRGRLTGFVDHGDMLLPNAKPVRDFRGWLWQGQQCVADTDCLKTSFFSIRLPVEMFQQGLFQQAKPEWPPSDLEQIRVHVEILKPGSDRPLFDSNSGDANPPFALSDLANTLQMGESLYIRKGGSVKNIIELHAIPDERVERDYWINKLIQYLPIDDDADVIQKSVSVTDVIHTSRGSYEVQLDGSAKAIDYSLSVVAGRLSWYVAGMLAAVALVWMLIEISFLRRVAILTKRAAAVSHNMQDYHDADIEKRIAGLDMTDLRGEDELGILAGGLSDLLQRVKEDVLRERIRAQQERDMWHAVGHEIMSPLQSLMVLHPKSEDSSYRYIQRMQHAVRVLYGNSSPSEAIEAVSLKLETIDMNEFLAHIAANASFAGVENVLFNPIADLSVIARVDEFSLEDAVTHILRNADRYRRSGTPVKISLDVSETTITIRIANQGSVIKQDMLSQIFEYGVSDISNEDQGEHRGQGLFVAKTYMSKMGGTIFAENTSDGVSFYLTLPRI